MSTADAADDEKTRLIDRSRRRFNEGFVPPQRLSFNKIYSVLGLVGRVLLWIKLELHRR